MPSINRSRQASRQSRDRQQQLNTQWIAGVLDKEGLTAHLQNSSDILALVRLKEILTAKVDELYTKQFATSTYDNPNWVHLQAHLNGQISTLNWIVDDLLSFVNNRTSK